MYQVSCAHGYYSDLASVSAMAQLYFPLKLLSCEIVQQFAFIGRNGRTFAYTVVYVVVI